LRSGPRAIRHEGEQEPERFLLFAGGFAQRLQAVDQPARVEVMDSDRASGLDGADRLHEGTVRAVAVAGGIPFLKDVPLLGLLAGSQSNTRIRTELLVLITPHVVHDQRDARALTEELRDQLINAARVPDDLQQSRASGSADPQRPVRRRLRLEQ